MLLVQGFNEEEESVAPFHRGQRTRSGFVSFCSPDDTTDGSRLADDFHNAVTDAKQIKFVARDTFRPGWQQMGFIKGIANRYVVFALVSATN